MRNRELVTSVFYAMVVGILCSHLTSIDIIERSKLIDFWNLLFLDISRIVIPERLIFGGGMYAYITMYFHDECKNSGVSDAEIPSLICLGWGLFLLQSALLKSLEVALLLGTTGIFIITIGLVISLFCPDIKLNRKIRVRYIAENIFLIIFQLLSLFSSCNYRKWYLIAPFIILIFRLYKTKK